jgi:hypothetical protein
VRLDPARCQTGRCCQVPGLRFLQHQRPGTVAVDGSKFKAVNNRDKNFTRAKMERRLAQIDDSVARYLSQLDTADLQEPSEALVAKTAHLKEKLAKLASELQRLKALEKAMLASPDQQISLTDPDSRSMARVGAARASSATTYRSLWTRSII